MEFVMGQAVKQDIKVLLENKPKFLLVHSSSGHKQALKEVLLHPSVTARLADTKVHVRTLLRFKVDDIQFQLCSGFLCC